MTFAQSITSALRAQPTSSAFSIQDAIEQHLPLVQKVARMAYHRYGRTFEHDDLLGYGNLGLVSAAKKYADLQYDIRQTIDFTPYAEKRIWRAIETGRDSMAWVRRTHYRMIKRGQMAKPIFVRDGGDFSLANAIADGREEPETTGTEAAEMLRWLSEQNPLWARVVDLHVNQGLSHERVGQLTGRSESAATSMCARALNLLCWKYNREAYHHDDRTARRQRAAVHSM